MKCKIVYWIGKYSCQIYMTPNIERPRSVFHCVMSKCSSYIYQLSYNFNRETLGFMRLYKLLTSIIFLFVLHIIMYPLRMLMYTKLLYKSPR